LAEPALPELSEAALARLTAFRRAVDPGRLRADVERLPGPRSRLHAPEAMAEADRIVSEGFQAAGWASELHAFSTSDVTGRIDYGTYPRTHYDHLEGKNVVATKPGSDDPDEVVVALAHHDTARDNPGANDNGAAVAVLLAAARLLAPCELRRTVVLAATDMEEIGFFGAMALLRELEARYRVQEAITLETVGYIDHEPGSQKIPAGFGLLYRSQFERVKERGFRGDFLAVLYNGPATSLAASFGAALAATDGTQAPLLVRAPAGVPVVSGSLRESIPVVADFFRGDHAPFWDAGLPALQVTDTANLRYPHYHEPTDTPDRIDYEHLANLAAATATTVAEAAGPLA
jgi:Zn-dependent M28 family amino/carboxypeptidase